MTVPLDSVVIKTLLIIVALFFSAASSSYPQEVGDIWGPDIYVLFDRSKDEGRPGVVWEIDDDGLVPPTADPRPVGVRPE